MKPPEEIVAAYGEYIDSCGHPPLELLERGRDRGLYFSNLPVWMMAADVRTQIGLLQRLDDAGLIRPRATTDVPPAAPG